MLFAWQPNFTPQANECFEVRFWEGGPDNWANGFGIAAHGKETSVSQRFDEGLERQLDALDSGKGFSWGVLLVDCEPYRVRSLLSGPRTITYTRP